MSKAKKRAKAGKRPVDDGYPFDTGDWEKWSNRKRLDWLINFRDKSRDKYKEKFNISGDAIAQMSTDVDAMEKVVLAEEYNTASEAARSAKSPRESAVMLGKLIDDICANDYYKARRIGLTDEQIDKMRADTDKYNREIEEWERRENARKILGFATQAKMPTDDIDDTELKKAFASGDEAAVEREWNKWIAKLEAKAAKDPIFAEWFHKFCADQERLLRWDDVIEDESK